jgi:hypothetical protein
MNENYEPSTPDLRTENALNTVLPEFMDFEYLKK